MVPVSDFECLVQAPEPILRAIILALCEDDKVCRKATQLNRQLMQHQHTVATSEGKSLKRKATSLAQICLQCGDVFTDDDNAKGSCWFHWGDLDVDDEGDFWADHDEDCHGLIDTEEMREEFPDGFIWSCCKGDGESRGCTAGRHEADPVKSLKRCGMEPAETSDEEEGGPPKQAGENGKAEKEGKE